MTLKVMGGKDPFESRIRITKEKNSGKYFVTGQGIFQIFDTIKEAKTFLRKNVIIKKIKHLKT